MTLEKAFGEELQKAREKSGLTQEKLGFESGYHRTYISQLERGKKSPTLKAIFKIALALGLKASDLVAKIERKSR
jgi:transcriptional regulator with XRE-family HTH domain